MTLDRKSKYYYEVTDKDVLEEILGDYGLESDVGDAEVTYQTMVKYDTTDWDFLLSRAEANAQVVLVDDGKVTTTKPDLAAEPELNVVYGATLIDFEAEMEARSQYGAVSSAAWDYTNQELVEAEAAEPSGSPKPGSFSTDDLGAVVEVDAYQQIHSGKLTEQELQAWSDSRLQKARISSVRGRARFQGYYNIKPGMIIGLEGVGERFNGNAFVSAVRHELAEGMRETDVQFGIDPELFSDTNDIGGPDASGVIPPISGLHIGVITALEGDPDGEFRARVQVPTISGAGGSEDGTWARVATLDAGDNRGSCFRPEIEDEVIVGFVNNDPRHAIILGCLHSTAKPTPIEPSDDNHEKGYVSRSDMRLLFNDDLNTITISTPNGNEIILSEDSGSILIKDENDNKIEMTSDGILMESPGDINITASGDVNIEGTNVNATANSQFKAEGSSGAEVSSGASTTIKGSIVQIN